MGCELDQKVNDLFHIDFLEYIVRIINVGNSYAKFIQSHFWTTRAIV